MGHQMPLCIKRTCKGVSGNKLVILMDIHMFSQQVKKIHMCSLCMQAELLTVEGKPWFDWGPSSFEGALCDVQACRCWGCGCWTCSQQCQSTQPHSHSTHMMDHLKCPSSVLHSNITRQRNAGYGSVDRGTRLYKWQWILICNWMLSRSKARTQGLLGARGTRIISFPNRNLEHHLYVSSNISE